MYLDGLAYKAAGELDEALMGSSVLAQARVGQSLTSGCCYTIRAASVSTKGCLFLGAEASFLQCTLRGAEGARE